MISIVCSTTKVTMRTMVHQVEMRLPILAISQSLRMALGSRVSMVLTVKRRLKVDQEQVPAVILLPPAKMGETS